jgi:hypothetical protein
MQAAERRTRLESELRQAGLRYTLHDNGQQAGFRYAQGHGPTLALVARIRNGALTLLCDQLACAVAEAGLVPALNQDWWLGRAWHADDGQIGLATGYPAFQPQSGPGLLRVYLSGLYAAAAALSIPGTNAAALAGAAAATRRLLPAQDMETEIVAIAAALQSIGEQFHQGDPLMLWQNARVGDGVDCRVEISAVDRHAVRVDTTTPLSRLPGAPRIDWLNRMAPIGAFIADEGGGVVRHRWAYSPAAVPPGPRSMAWLLEVAGQMALLAHRDMPARAGSAGTG